MDQNETVNIEQEATQGITITNVNEFGMLVEGWHSLQMKKLNHIAKIPQGQKVSIGEENEEFILEGDAHKGFLIGLGIAMHHLGTLPYSEVPEHLDS